MNAAINPARPAPSDLVTCTKCLGSGRHTLASMYSGKVYDYGICFECEGTGKITAAKREVSKWTRTLAGTCHFTCNIILLAARDGNDERAEFYSRTLVKTLFLLGTTHAREVLAYLAKGQWFDDAAETRENTRGQIALEHAAALRARVIEIGREARA